MKKCILFASILLVLFQPRTSASTGSENQQVPAIVYFFRLPNYSNSAAKMTIIGNDQPVVRLRNGCYFKYEVQPGDYIFTVAFGSSTSVKLSVEAGRDYYIRCYINNGLWSGIPIIELVDPMSGKSTIEGNRLFLQPPEAISLKPRNSRFGLFMSGGVGMESVPWFYDTDGNEITLSTGGGFGIGAEYGHQFSSHFDLSATLAYQGSTLSETLKNADGSFDRMVINVTPSLVLPIKGGERLRLKLGAGPGYYGSGIMKIDGSQISGGSKYTIYYKPAFGYHFVFLLEAKLMERGSMNLGIRYSDVKYGYNSGKSQLYITEPKVSNPDGSAVDFFFGYYFLF